MATSKCSRMRRFSRSRPARGSSASACANVRFFFPLLDACWTSISSSPSARWCPWTAEYSSSSSESPPSRRKGDPNVGLGARGGGDVAGLFVELVDPELECPLPTTLVTSIRPLRRRDIRLLFDFSSDSSILTWIVTTIGACGS